MTIINLLKHLNNSTVMKQTLMMVLAIVVAIVVAEVVKKQLKIGQ